MKQVFLVAAIIGAFALSGCAQQSTKAEAPAASAEMAAYEAALAAANAQRKQAAAVGGEWRDTGKLIKQAEKSAAEGNFADAVKQAKKAEAQGKVGKEQALSQRGVGNPGYLYN